MADVSVALSSSQCSQIEAIKANCCAFCAFLISNLNLLLDNLILLRLQLIFKLGLHII